MSELPTRGFIAGLDPTIDIFEDPRQRSLPPAAGSEALPSEPSYFQRAGQIHKDSFTPRLPTREDIIGRAEALGTIGSSVPAFGAGILGLIGNLACLLYTSPSPRDGLLSRMPSSA